MAASIEAQVDGLMVARRLAQFCPTSLSMDLIPNLDVKKRKKLDSNKSADQSTEFIPPVSQVVTQASPTFHVGIPQKRNRFGFLLEDIKPLEKPAAGPAKMRYELPNVKEVTAPVKYARPLMVVSLSLADLKNKSEKGDGKE